MARFRATIPAITLLLWPVAGRASNVTPSQRVKRAVVVRSGQSTESVPLDALKSGDRARLSEERSGWYCVTPPDGRTGYVSKAWTIVVDEAHPPSATAAGEVRAHVIDVRTGLAVFVEGAGFAML